MIKKRGKTKKDETTKGRERLKNEGKRKDEIIKEGRG